MKEKIENVLKEKEEEKKTKKETNLQNKHASQRVNPKKMTSREKLILAQGLQKNSP